MPTSSPTTVRWSGVRPVLRNPSPIGLTAASTGLRNLPSNVVATLPDSGGELGVVFHELLEDTSVDGVDEHQSASCGRIVGRVAEHPPGRPAAQPAPHLLGRGVPDRES